MYLAANQEGDSLLWRAQKDHHLPLRFEDHHQGM